MKTISLFGRVGHNGYVEFSFTGKRKYPIVNLARIEIRPDEWPLRFEVAIPDEARLVGFGNNPKLCCANELMSAKQVYGYAHSKLLGFEILNEEHSQPLTMKS